LLACLSIGSLIHIYSCTAVLSCRVHPVYTRLATSCLPCLFGSTTNSSLIKLGFQFIHLLLITFVCIQSTTMHHPNYDPTYLYPDYASYPAHLLTTTTTPPPLLPTMTTIAPTTGPSTPDGSPPPSNSYPWHLYPPLASAATTSTQSILSISRQNTPGLADLPAIALSSSQHLQSQPSTSRRSPTRLSPLFPSADIMASSESNSSTPSGNVHHQSHSHLFPEQSHSGGGGGGGGGGASSYRSPSSAEYQYPSSSNHHSSSAALYSQHGGGGPALQVTHPSASSSAALDMFRHRSASPWIPPHQQQNDHHHLGGSGGGGSTGYSHSSNALHGGNSHAMSYYSNNSNMHSSYASHHHPLSQSHAPLAYNFPSSNYTIHDPYQSPEQSHTALPYGYSSHSQHQLHYHSLASGTSSLLDKHLSSNTQGAGTSQHHNNNSKYSAGVNSEYSQDARSSRAVSTTKATSSSSATKNKAASTNKRAASGGDDDSAAGGAGGAGQNNYGIIDESITTLWDLKDGPDGPHGKPRE